MLRFLFTFTITLTILAWAFSPSSSRPSAEEIPTYRNDVYTIDGPIPTMVTTTTTMVTTTTVPDPAPEVDEALIWREAVAATLANTTTTVPAPPHTHQTSFTASYPEGKECPMWLDLAVQVGWAPEELDTLSYVMWKESRCQPEVHYTADPNGGSRGLTQINGYWCKPTSYNPDGYLQGLGILTTCDDLYDPAINLRSALAVWQYGVDRGSSNPWSPWSVR